MLCIEDRTSTVVYALSLHDALPICGVIATRTRRSGIGAAAAVEHRVIDGEGVLGSEEADHRVSTTTDRKSTRLNSSHVKISYAVFCLKKKNYTRGQIGQGATRDIII